MPDELPPDPFGPPEEILSIMKGLSQLHSAGMMAGLSESVMTQFISNVFLTLSMMQNAPAQTEE
jgi:hypothetical protein